MSAFFVCCGFSLQAGAAHAAPSGIAQQVCSIAAHPAAPDTPLHWNASDIDDDSNSAADDDGDGDGDVIGAVVASGPSLLNDNGRHWLLDHTKVDPWSPLPSRDYSLRAPPL